MILFASVAAATLSLPTPRPSPRPAATAAPLRGTLDAGELYSLRERRRIAVYLRLRLAEMRREHLDRVVDVIERRLPASVLIDDPTAPPR